MDILKEKIDQAIALLAELDTDMWLLLVRETVEMADPSFKMIAPANVVWPSAFIFSRRGERIVIAGRFDAEIFRRSGLYSEVLGYDQGLGQDLRQVISRLNPRQIAINYSTSSHTADGISHGMYLNLQEILANTPFASRLTSGEAIVARLRGRKSPGEVQRVRAAVEAAQDILAGLTPELQYGRTEKDIAAIVHKQVAAAGLQTAWEASGCPIVNAGPSGESGHAGPTDQHIQPGQVIHLDFGVRKEGFCSDLQRVWYVLRPGERQAPREVQRAFFAVRRAIEAGMTVLKPGAVAWQVDAAARQAVVDAGYPEYMHAFAHQLGRAAHDGGSILGPRWERYGNTPMGIVEAGNIFTPELSVQTGAGMVGLEEDVLVTDHGCEFLSTPQTDLWYV